MNNTFDISEFVNVLTEEKVKENLVKRVKARRKELKITQKELAQMSAVSYGSIRRFELSGEISLSSLIKIANVMHCLEDFEFLFKNEIISDLKNYKV